MNKQEAINELMSKSREIIFGDDENVYLSRKRTIELISQIHEPEKVTVPKFVAEWIESQKKSFSDVSAIDMYDNLTLDNSGGYYHDVWLWVIDHHYDFIKAWHDGYTFEQEKLYTVEIPDPHGIYKIRYLCRNSVGNIRIGGSDYSDVFLNAGTHLTEAEIKKDFEWAWQWAKEVEE